MMRRYFELLKRELRLALRQGSDSMMVVGFFVLAVILFPFGIGPEPSVLARVASGLIWVNALLAAMLSLDRLYQGDYEDGSLELLILTPAPLELLVAAKVTAHWLTTGLPLMAAAPLLAIFLNLNAFELGVVLLTLAVGTPALSLIGSVGAALVLGARRGGVLISLLVLPLFIPVLIFAVGAVDAASHDLPWTGQLAILGAILLGTVPLGLYASAAALRQAAE
jgi:heme exporter protein B